MENQTSCNLKMIDNHSDRILPLTITNYPLKMLLLLIMSFPFFRHTSAHAFSSAVWKEVAKSW